jgi:predicted component of type VI protein secretion system
MTIKALLPSPRYTEHDATESVLRNIRNLLTNCIFKAVNVREGVSKKVFRRCIEDVKLFFVNPRH